MSPSVQTFVAVIVGAVLASVGGFAATQLGIWIDRSRRAQQAALLSGEILAAIGTLLRLADQAAQEGTFLDPVPARLLSFARREIDVYDRNREALFGLADPALRARLHGFIVRLSIPLDRLADSRAGYVGLCATAGSSSEQADTLRTEMQATYDYLMDSRSAIPGLLARLQPLARANFDTYGRLGPDGTLADP